MKQYEVQFSESLRTGEGNLLDDFTFPWLDRPTPRTEFRAVWNHDRLAFAFDVDDDDIVLPEADDPGEGALGSDRCEIFVAPNAELTKPYYGAEMDPSGRVFDYRAKYHREFDPAWSFATLEFSGAIREGGYAVTGSLALEELRDLGCLVDGGMIAGVYRAEFSHGEGGAVDENWIAWVDPGGETPDFHVPGSFGRFRFLD